MTKKILSMLLAVLMVVSMIPMAAMAAEGEGSAAAEPTVISAEDAASGLQLSKSGTYKLGADIETPYILAGDDANLDVTLDLNGHSITQTGSYSLFWVDSGITKLTIKNSATEQGVIKNNGTANTFDISGEGCELTIGENVKVQKVSESASAGYTIAADNVSGTTKINLNGCTIEDTWVLGINGTVKTPVEIKLDGATIKTDGIGLYQAGMGATSDVDVRNSTITVDAGGESGIEVRAGSLNLVNTTITVDSSIEYTSKASDNGSTSTGAAIAVAQHSTKLPIQVTLDENVVAEGPVALSVADPNNTGATESVTVKVAGGKYKGEIKVTDTAADVSFTGGKFSDRTVEPYLASTYKLADFADTTYKYEVVEAKGLTSGVPTSSDGAVSTTVTGTFAGAVSGESADKTTETATTVTINATTTNKDAGITIVNIPVETANTLKDEAGKAPEVTVETDAATVVLPGEAVQKIAAAEEDVTITVKETTPPTGVKAEYIVDVKAGENDLLSTTALGNTEVGIQIIVKEPTGLTDAQKDALQAWYVKDGKLVDKLDTLVKDGKVTVTIGHLSTIQLRVTNVNAIAMKDDGTEYETAAAFATAVAEGGNFTLLKNVELNSNLTIGNGIEVVIDGQGNTISPSESNAVAPGAFIKINSGAKGNNTAKLTLKDVKIDGKNKSRVIETTNGTLIYEAGTEVTNGSYSACGGVFITNQSVFTMNGGKITGNKNSNPAYQNDGDWQYCSDLWIGAEANGTITGGEVGNAYVNANSYTPSDDSVRLTISGTAKVDNVFVEAYQNNVSKVLANSGGTIGTMYIALSYDVDTNTDTRLIASVPGSELTGKNVTVTALSIPGGVTATAVQRGDKNPTLDDNITINGTLIIPEGMTVVTNGTAVITVNGTLDVKGALIAGATDKDTTYVQISGTGDVLGENIDLDKGENGTAKAVTVTFLSEGKLIESVVVNVFKVDGAWVNKEITPPTQDALEAKPGYVFAWWQNGVVKVLEGDKVTVYAETATDGKIIRYVAYWIENWENPFNDVKDNAWYYEAVQYVYENGLMSGVGSGKFSPSGLMTRAQFAKVVYALAGSPAVSADSTALNAFTDKGTIPPWATSAMTWAVEAGVMNGATPATLKPNANVTREQAVTMLYRYAGSPAVVSDSTVLNAFVDSAKVSTYAVSPMKWAVTEGYISGSGNKLNPGSVATRAEAAKIFMKYSQANNEYKNDHGSIVMD